MWKLYQRSKAFRLNPADEMGIDEGAWLRWMFNQAVHTFGAWVEGQLAERDKQGKPVHKIERLLDLPIQPRKLSLSQFYEMGMEEG